MGQVRLTCLLENVVDHESLAWWQSCSITCLENRLGKKHYPVVHYETMLPEHTTFCEGSSSVKILLEVYDSMTGSLPFLVLLNTCKKSSKLVLISTFSIGT